EEEIFGIVYNNKVRTTSAGFVVTLQQAGGGACIYHFTTSTPNCLGSQTMVVNPTGIRPGATSNMWGWYNNLDTDLNPCNLSTSNHNERHDENPRDGVPDSGIEKHCVKPGKYIVTLQNGAVTRTRTVDHRLVKGQMGNGKAIEDTTVSSPTANNFKDTIVHFDVSSGSSYTLQKLDSIAIDNPLTTGEFAPGDSVVPINERVRINSEVTTAQWDLSLGRLLARTYFQYPNLSIRSDHWNPDEVVRTRSYPAANTYEVRVEATTPNKADDFGIVSSKGRKVVVHAPTGDQAAPAGNTFPSSMTGGGIVSVTLTMRNTGTTTWTSSAGYKLKLFRNTALWLPLTPSLPSSVSPGASVTFAFDLRNLEPGVTGSQPAFYKMAKGTTFFGAENGRDIVITSKSSTALATLNAAGPEALSNETVAGWVARAEDAGTSDLPITASALQSNGSVVLEYSYAHEASRALDIVLKFTFDPKLLEALRIEPAEGATGLAIESGLTAPGEYWVRMTGTVPAGEGLIAGLPFRLVAGAKLPRNGSLGTLTVYYP
ncbi:MAG TPA: hypothetical protein VJP59_12045, partial [Gemmatimonadota bacterium]|nr:hypothetical protein [Gemmatimonadota bacterium]